MFPSDALLKQMSLTCILAQTFITPEADSDLCINISLNVRTWLENANECGYISFVLQDFSKRLALVSLICSSDHSWCLYGGLVVKYLCLYKFFKCLNLHSSIHSIDTKVELNDSVLWAYCVALVLVKISPLQARTKLAEWLACCSVRDGGDQTRGKSWVNVWISFVNRPEAAQELLCLDVKVGKYQLLQL